MRDPTRFTFAFDNMGRLIGRVARFGGLFRGTLLPLVVQEGTKANKRIDL
jgi:hypothetical protein